MNEIMTGPGTNTYLLGEGELAVVDPGPDDPGHRRAVLEAAARCEIRWVLVTHTHRDHAPGAVPLAAALPGPSRFGPCTPRATPATTSASCSNPARSCSPGTT